MLIAEEYGKKIVLPPVPVPSSRSYPYLYTLWVLLRSKIACNEVSSTPTSLEMILLAVIFLLTIIINISILI